MLINIALTGVLLVGLIFSVNCSDLEYTEIKIIGQNNSYQSLNPQATFEYFDKVRHVKGSIFFSKGARIQGDRLIENLSDSDQFGKPEDIEVFFRYPVSGKGLIITAVEVLADVDQSSIDAITGFVKGTGGINSQTFEMLVQCKFTGKFAYELFLYGY